jgi:hypothetical protein
MGQQFFKPFNGMVWDAAEHLLEPGKGIDLNQFAGGNKAAQHGRRLAAVVAAEEGPVVTIMLTCT